MLTSSRLKLPAIKYYDLMLAIMIVTILAFLILPIKPGLIDLLITTNLAASIVVLMVSLYIPSSLALSSFPTILLLSTLFRLSLNVSTTRQILLHADAGQIIYTFGNFVVGGNYIVGACVFIIITIVQFVVIAKGAERVSEVTARFTLDAMPGKQMSIDGDLRSGSIDLLEAKRRRNMLEDESKLFGAMDGAMKFIKGDAIAGIIITVINIIGGICIGTLQKELPLGMAANKYTILTIGDGLVSQIPALIVCITSAIIVTRIDTPEDNSSLADELFKQIISRPKALIIGGIILSIQGFVPGFPKLQFFSVSVIIILSGLFLYHLSKKAQLHHEQVKEASAISSRQSHPKDALSLAAPIIIDIAESERQHISVKYLEERIVAIGQKYYFDSGVPFPGVSTRFNSRLPAESYTILVYEVPLYSGKIYRDKLLVNAVKNIREILDRVRIGYNSSEIMKPQMMQQTVWVDSSHRQLLEENNIPLLDTHAVICHHLSLILRRHSVEFLNISEVRHLLDLMEHHFAPLVSEALKTLPIQSITEVLRYLAEECIPIRNLKLLLETIVENGSTEKNASQLGEYARERLKRHIAHKFSDDQNTLHTILFDSELEDYLGKNLRRTPAGVYFAISPEVSQSFLDQIQQEMNNTPALKPVLLTSMELRRHVRKLIEKVVPNVAVLSYNELTSDINIKPFARIKLP